MGNIKHTFIKRTGNEIYENYPDRVSSEFDKNKDLVNELVESGVLECESKSLRNKLAGYLSTKLEKINKKTGSYKNKTN